MGEAGSTLGLGAESDVVVHGHHHDRGGVIGGDDDPQPVAEREALEGKGHPGPRRCRTGGHPGDDTRA